MRKENQALKAHCLRDFPQVSPLELVLEAFHALLETFGQPFFFESSSTVACLLNVDLADAPEDTPEAGKTFCAELRDALSQKHHETRRQTGVLLKPVYRRHDTYAGHPVRCPAFSFFSPKISPKIRANPASVLPKSFDEILKKLFSSAIIAWVRSLLFRVKNLPLSSSTEYRKCPQVCTFPGHFHRQICSYTFSAYCPAGKVIIFFA